MIDKQSAQLYKRLLRYITPYRKAVALVIFTLALTAAMEPMMPALLKPLIDDSLIGKDPDSMVMVPLYLVIIFVIKGFAEYASKVASEWIAHKAIVQLRSEMFAKINRLPLQTHHDYTSGKLLSKITYDVQQVAQSLSQAWIVIIRDTLIILALLGFLFYTSWQMTLAILVIGPFIALIIDRASRMMRQSSKDMQNSMGDITQSLEEGINGHKEIKIYGAEEYEEQRFGERAEQHRQHTMSVVKVAAANVPMVQTLAALAMAGILFMATSLNQQELFSPGEFIAFITAMALIFEPIRRLTNINVVVQRGTAAAESIFELLDQPEETNQGQQTLNKVHGEIAFHQVSFAYPSSENPLFKNLNMTIPAQQTVAFVGGSGSGKSTLANLITRFYTPNKGSIQLDGVDLQQLNLGFLREQIAFVSQNVTLFNDTIAANIAYGQANISDQQITAAAKAAHAWEFIEKLPQGLNTPVGDKGNQLSGGQRQRIALARAFLKNAPILIMDEATSALDNHSEKMVQLAMEQLKQNRTVIIIAHRLSTIESADKIFVFEQGQLLEQGCHAELLARAGHYAKLYQQGEFDSHG